MNVYVALGAWVLVVHRASIATCAEEGVRVARESLADVGHGPMHAPGDRAGEGRRLRCAARHKILAGEPYYD